MRTIDKYLLSAIASMLVMINAFGQQGPQYTQFMFNNLAINPAYAGADEYPSVTIVARNQWTRVDNAPSTQSLTAQALFARRVGVGLVLVHDKIGVHKNTNAVASLAYHLRVSKKAYVSMGLQTGINNFKSDYPSLQANGNDPLLSKYVSDTKMSLGAGIYFRSSRFDAGISAPGLLSNKFQVNDTAMVRFRNANVLGYVRYRFPLNTSFSLQPSVLIKYFPDLPMSFDANLMIVYKQVLSTGVSYRQNESIDLVIKLQLTKKLEAGYSYDYPVGSGGYLNSSSSEVMLHYVFRKERKNITSPR